MLRQMYQLKKKKSDGENLFLEALVNRFWLTK